MGFDRKYTETLPLDQLCVIDKCCEKFDAGWSEESTAAISAVLESTDASIHAALMHELLVTDIERRSQNDCLKPQSFYLSQFPNYSDEVKAASQSAIDMGICLPDLQIGRYFVRGKIGKGGMGQILQAVDPELKREVAIKSLLPKSNANPNRLSRFKNEMTSLAKLAHPNIVTIYDVVKRDGSAYAVMQLLTGSDLEGKLRKGRMEHDTALQIIIETANGIAAAHDRGIIHRDIKPANIFITEEGRVKVLDFGIARLKRESVKTGSENRSATTPGQVIGTVDYMSPEQLRGQEIDVRSDVFSLGAVLFEMVVGQKPFAQPTIADTKAAILNQSPSYLDSVVVPSKLKRTIDRCLQKDPESRFQSVAEFIEHAQLALDSNHHQPVGSVSISWKWLAVAGSAFLFMLLGFAFLQSRSLFAPARISEVDSIAVLPFAGEISELYIKDGLTFSLTDSLSKLDWIDVRPFAIVRELHSGKKSEQNVEAIYNELDVQAVITGVVNQLDSDNVRIAVELIDTKSGHTFWGAKYELPIDEVLEAQNQILKDVVNELRQPENKLPATQETSPTTSLAAYKQFIHGQIALSQRQPDSVKLALESFQNATNLDPRFEKAYVGLADCFIVQAERNVVRPSVGFEMARQYAKKALEVNADSVDAKISLAMIAFEYDWDFETAEKRFLDALPHEVSDDSEVKHPTGHQWFAEFLSATGRYERALEQIQIAKEQDPASDIVKTVEGLIHLKAGRFGEAIARLLNVVEHNPDFDRARGYLIDAFDLTEQTDRALIQWTALAKSDQHVIDEMKNAYKDDGDRGYWAQRLKLKNELAKIRSVSPLFLTIAHTKNADTQTALALIGEAISKKDGSVAANLLVHPMFDNLRSTTEFKAFLEQVGFRSDN